MAERLNAKDRVRRNKSHELGPLGRANQRHARSRRSPDRSWQLKCRRSRLPPLRRKGMESWVRGRWAQLAETLHAGLIAQLNDLAGDGENDSLTDIGHSIGSSLQVVSRPEE